MQTNRRANSSITPQRNHSFFKKRSSLPNQLAKIKDFFHEISLNSSINEIEDESRIHSPKFHDTHAFTNYFAKRVIGTPDVSNKLFIRDKATEKKCLMILQNLISEQRANKFDAVDFRTNLSQDTAIKFRFFLNGMEILAQLLNIINVKNYDYRTKDYGKYEVFHSCFASLTPLF